MRGKKQFHIIPFNIYYYWHWILFPSHWHVLFEFWFDWKTECRSAHIHYTTIHAPEFYVASQINREKRCVRLELYIVHKLSSANLLLKSHSLFMPLKRFSTLFLYFVMRREMVAVYFINIYALTQFSAFNRIIICSLHMLNSMAKWHSNGKHFRLAILMAAHKSVTNDFIEINRMNLWQTGSIAYYYEHFSMRLLIWNEFVFEWYNHSNSKSHRCFASICVIKMSFLGDFLICALLWFYRSSILILQQKLKLNYNWFLKINLHSFSEFSNWKKI